MIKRPNLLLHGQIFFQNLFEHIDVLLVTITTSSERGSVSRPGFISVHAELQVLCRPFVYRGRVHRLDRTGDFGQSRIFEIYDGQNPLR